jgi:hypothetical protein
MDELRVQAYGALIEQLLHCPPGQEAEILQAQQDLVDAGLLVVMEHYAAYLESQGSNSANWLRKFAAQLAQVVQPGAAAAGAGQASSAAEFLRQTLLLIRQIQKLNKAKKRW